MDFRILSVISLATILYIERKSIDFIHVIDVSVSTTQKHDHQINKVQEARNRTRISILKTYLSDFKKIKNSIINTKSRIESLREERDTIDSKRKRLMQQNFSSADHLKKTHTKYWNKFQRLNDEINLQEQKLKNYLDEAQQMRRKILELRDEIIGYN